MLSRITPCGRHCSGEEPTDADFEKFDEAKSAMHKAAEKAMINAIKERGNVEDL